MASYTPNTDLWLERSRLDGMLLAAVSYGIFLILTLQATVALVRKPRRGQIPRHRRLLLGYVWITFILATIGFAGNAKYTEMIWIDLRNAPGGPAALILNEFDYQINLIALACYYCMEWFMQALLLYRCFVFWAWQKYIVVPMSTLFVAMVAMSLLLLAESSGAVFYNIKTQLAYLCIQVGMTIIYTILVAGRLFSMRAQLRDSLEKEHLRPYEIAATMVIESALIYTVLGVLFIFTFAFHSNISNLVLLSISQVQGIAQLLIIVRVAKGKTQSVMTRTGADESLTAIEFSGPGSKGTTRVPVDTTRDPLA